MSSTLVSSELSSAEPLPLSTDCVRSENLRAFDRSHPWPLVFHLWAAEYFETRQSATHSLPHPYATKFSRSLKTRLHFHVLIDYVQCSSHPSDSRLHGSTDMTLPRNESAKLPRRVPVDLEKPEAILKQRGLSKNAFAMQMGKADAAFLRHWQNGRQAFVRTVREMATVLGLDDWRELVVGHVPQLLEAKPVYDRNECRVEELFVRTIGLPDPLGSPRDGTVYCSEDFLSKVERHFPIEMRDLVACRQAFEAVLDDWTVIGWLIKNSDGTYTFRYWTDTQCWRSIEVRCYNELGAISSLVETRDRSKASRLLYDRVMKSQSDLLAKMKPAHEYMLAYDCEKTAIKIIDFDNKFHHKWGEQDAPGVATPLDVSRHTIDHSTHRFVETIKRCKQRGISVPRDFPSLQSLVAAYYPQLREIFAAVQKLQPGDRACKMHILDLLSNHARDGFETVRSAERLVLEWPRRPIEKQA